MEIIANKLEHMIVHFCNNMIDLFKFRELEIYANP